MGYALWHGSSAEARELVDVFLRNCSCVYEHGVRKSCCAAHEAFTHDQRMLDGLLWMRRERQRLLHDEWTT